MAGLLASVFGGGNLQQQPFSQHGRVMPYVRALKAYSEIFMPT